MRNFLFDFDSTLADTRDVAVTATQKAYALKGLAIPSREAVVSYMGVPIEVSFAKMAQGFGMRVISYSRHKKTDPKYDFIEQVDFDTLLAESDVISIHAPLTPSTEDTFDADAFAKMRDGTILINTARGGLIVEEALVDALQSGKVYGAGLDVIRDEPPKGDNPLLHQDNAAITAHIAWLTRASRLRAIDIAIDNFKAYLRGEPVSVINK